MRILGIDPGLNTTGFGLIEYQEKKFVLKDAGCIRTSSEQGLQKRLHKLHKALSQLIKEDRPEIIVLEKLYAHYKHPITACLLGHARGVICLVAEQNKIRLYEYSATRVKKSITGNGHASKGQVQKMILQFLKAERLASEPVDISDALSLAVAHAYIIRDNS